MNTLLTVLHVIVCVFLILVVLLQAGKGGGMGIAFGGGGSQTVFGSSGAGNFLTRLTSITAVIFMVTSLALAHNSSQQDSKRLQKLEAVKQAQKKAEDERLAKLKADLEKNAAAHAGQSSAPGAAADAGATGTTLPPLPLNHPTLKLTPPGSLGTPGSESKPGNVEEPAKPGKGEQKAKTEKAPADKAAAPAAPGEKPARKRKKAPATEGGEAPAPAPAAAPPPQE
jgi:preprotein translocase subunit SecG